MWPLSEDTYEVVLLCAWFAGERESLPLGLQEYNLLASWLYQQDLRPRDLRDQSCVEKASASTGLNIERLTGLLNRRISLGFYLEDWRRRGLWVIGRGDDAYPLRIHQQLRSIAPPLLFGAGETSLLGMSSTAVIGPSEQLFQPNNFIQALAELCIQHHRTMIISGKHHISTQLIGSGIDHGGAFIWLRPGLLLGEPLDKSCRHAKASGNIVLLSSRSPADPRLFPEEPEIGSLLMALSDDVIYIDGTELSVDCFNLESALLQSLPQKKCFIYRNDPITSLAETLLSSGAQPWIDEDIAIGAGLFKSSEMKQKAVSTHDIEHASAEPENTTLSSSGMSLKQSVSSAAAALDKLAPAPSSIESVCKDGVQGELFD